jgi:hypothetical protein
MRPTYVDYAGEVYGLLQVRRIALQFYDGLLAEARATEGYAHGA